MPNYYTLQTLALFLATLHLATSSISTTTDYSTLSNKCIGSPYWNLNHCNISCSTCLPTDSNKCLTCDSNYTQSGVFCKLTNDTYTYISQTYFTSAVLQSSQLTPWSNYAYNKKLTTRDCVAICYTNSYNFVMIGLFGKDDKLNIDLGYTNQMSYITLKFNLLLLVNHVSLEVDLSQKSIYTQVFSSLSDLDATYFASTNDSVTSILSIPSLSSTNVGTVLQVISFSSAIATKDINLYFAVSGSSTSNFWAISDVSILLRQCDTCPTAELMATISSIGQITLYTTAVTVPLILVFWLAVKLKDHFEKTALYSRKGGKTLPMKAIQRVCEYLKKKSRLGSGEQQDGDRTRKIIANNERKLTIMKKLITRKNI